MTLSDRAPGSRGRVIAVGGGEHTHRRLVDLGLVGSAYEVRAKRRRSVLVDFGGELCAVVELSVAAQIEVSEER